MKNYFCKNDKMLFDLLMKGAEQRATPTEIEMVKKAFQAFVMKPIESRKVQIQALKKQIQGVSSSTDFPINVTAAFNITMDEANYDMGYEAAFQDVPRDETKNFWEIVTAHNGITFRRIAEGQRIRVEDMSGDLVYAHVDYYGGALGFTDAMIRFRQIAIMYDRAKAFRDSFFINKADNHYILLATAAALQITLWQPGATILIRDVTTLNLAAANLGFVNRNKGYAVTGNTPFLLYASPLDEARIEAAYAVQNNGLVAAIAGVPAIGGRPVRRIYTYNQFIIQNRPILVLPGQKIQKNEALAPTTYNAPEDILTLNKMSSVWSIYGAAIADAQQVMQVNLV